MQIKVLTVEALSTTRQKLTIGDAIEQAVSGFIQSEDGGELVNATANLEYISGHYGKAVVLVIYQEKSKTKKKEVA